MNPQEENQVNASIKYATALQMILGGTVLYFGAIFLFAQLFVAAL
jgi:hypothetical protein